MSHVTHINESVGHMKESCHTNECFLSHICMRHVTHMNAACHTHERVMPHIWMRDVSRMNESCNKYECVMLHIRINHIAHAHDACHTCIHLVNFSWWVLQYCTGFARLVWGRLRVHRAFISCHTCIHLVNSQQDNKNTHYTNHSQWGSWVTT